MTKRPHPGQGGGAPVPDHGRAPFPGEGMF
jgi:hypothetical protein